MPDDAYRFAKGNQLTSTTGYPVKLSRPLDFLVVADHSDNMGFFPRLRAGDPDMLANPTGQRWYDMVNEGGTTAVDAAVEIILSLTNNNFPEPLYLAPGTPGYQEAWQLTMDAADAANAPGEFTAFIGYEWTSTESGLNLHRVVLYRDGKDKAELMEPYTSIPPWGSPDERNLWGWLAEYEKTTGGQVLAIPHNGNLSNGHMFPLKQPLFGAPLDRDYAENRARWEPLYEITQIKGDGETHPLLSPDDEFADYETWDQGNLDLSQMKTDDMLEGEYGRRALQLKWASIHTKWDSLARLTAIQVWLPAKRTISLASTRGQSPARGVLITPWLKLATRSTRVGPWWPRVIKGCGPGKIPVRRCLTP
jgi:hypothetical protein